MKDKIINSLLRFCFRYRKIDKALSKHKWYKDLIQKQARKIIDKL
jgi:hypothetical protein